MQVLPAFRRHRQVLGLWVLAVLFALACIALGRWQWGRFESKRAAKALVERNYGAAAVPLPQLLADGQSFDPALVWRPVQVTGRYDVAGTVLVRNRPRDPGDNQPVYGYEVLVPLVTAGGRSLLVDRGWIPNGTRGAAPGQEPDSVPTPPSGQVTVVAHLRGPEPHRDQRLPADQVGSIDLTQVASMTGLTLYPAYGQLAGETPPVATAPDPLGRPVLDGGEGINASYAVQWGLFAAMGLGFPWWWRRRQRLAEAEDLAQAEAATEPTLPGLREPVGATRPKRRRIWDEEDE